MTKNWIVENIIENAWGTDSVEVDSFNTEEEALAKIAKLEAEDVEEYGEVVNEYTYYNINE